MMYNISSAGDKFIVYRDATLADTNDDSTWRNTGSANPPCTNCKKRGNTCLHWVIDLYGDVDRGACVWCSVRGVGCSIKQQVRGTRGAGSPKKSLGKGKRKASEVSEGEVSDGSGGEGPSRRTPEVRPARSLPPTFTPLPPPPMSPSPATPLFVESFSPTPVPPAPPSPVSLPPAPAPNTSPVFALTDAIKDLSEVVGGLQHGLAEVRKGVEGMRAELVEVREGLDELRENSRLHRRLVEVQLERERRRNLMRLVRTARGVDSDGEVFDWQGGVSLEKVYRMGKRFKKRLDGF